MYRMFNLNQYEFEKIRILMRKLGKRPDFSYNVFVNYFKTYIPFEDSHGVYSLQDYMYEHDGNIPEGINRTYGLEEQLSDFNTKGIWNFFQNRNGKLDFFDFLNYELNTSLLDEFRNYYDISYNMEYYSLHRASGKRVPNYVKKQLRRYIGNAANNEKEFYFYGKANDAEYLIRHPFYRDIYVAYDKSIFAKGISLVNVL